MSRKKYEVPSLSKCIKKLVTSSCIATNEQIMCNKKYIYSCNIHLITNNKFQQTCS